MNTNINTTTDKNTNYSETEIEEYLKEFKELIQQNKYTISYNDNRDDNKKFVKKYKMPANRQKDILMSLECNDFCYSTTNRKKGYEYEELYVFCKETELSVFGKYEEVKIYIKTNMINDSQVIVISFHEANYDMKYCFKK